jgi:hypothetical protein
MQNAHARRSTTELVKEMRRQVSAAAELFERRWTYAALRRTDPDLASRLHDQGNLFADVCVTGAGPEITEQGEALVRGFAAAVRAMESAAEPDDAYMLGSDLVTGLKVAIGQQKAAVARVREIHGEKVLWVSPDEVARMLAGIESFKFVGAVKKLFPGAEIIDRYEEEGAHGEGERLEEASDSS